MLRILFVPNLFMRRLFTPSRAVALLFAGAVATAPRVARAESDRTYTGCDALVCVMLRQIISAPSVDRDGRTLVAARYTGTVSLIAPFAGVSNPVLPYSFVQFQGGPPSFNDWADYGLAALSQNPISPGVWAIGNEGFGRVEPGTPVIVQGTFSSSNVTIVARYNVALSEVPEPSTAALAAVGGLGLAGLVRRRARQPRA